MPATRKTSAPAPSPEPTDADGANVDERVYAAVSKALLSGKLRPGTPLRERALAEALGCTRGAVRKVLARLGSEKRLVLEHNRGAFVPNPSIEDMRGTYRARRIVEAGLVTTLFGQLAREQVATLRKHVQAEQKAFKEGRREDAVRLAGDFHLLLAQMAGSDELLSYIGRLIANTELYKALYDSAEAASCAPREHEQIIDALTAGKSLDKALAVALEHLDELERRVIAGAAAEQETDLATLLNGGAEDPHHGHGH
ncbi:GntR family transcriptional regulator [Variovorax paradoxus]|jgi:DNA-binding GntR family transcriptional regulator|uniref:GntR family transcriptional regulator n=1 Tax=Variovorax paradoxus TaxID=34073 RepID=UPI0006E68379|nr:GntR family transcriptional regulator [Variovorax paradoxus]KPV02567.1 GntR family transcriptional regulator [Variovorax paradoxus]KPV03466.1 GntR family transcriptional regulator [Variovorax paradoxus]KPV23916.1 GntR family transcriptional regulator [Variovorax paradoxus]KPV29331.1 GntR family transcriptional regulator [Variovorax paradoxus]